SAIFFFLEVNPNNSRRPIEKVRLQFQYLQFKYFQSKPFHKYEKIKENPDKTVEIEMELRPNYELTRKIVSMGNGVKVLQPASLVEKVKEYLQDALAQYK
ncbi:MAG: WYL domain-containing protein, partial [Chitinophagales bacterium]